LCFASISIIFGFVLILARFIWALGFPTQNIATNRIVDGIDTN